MNQGSIVYSYYFTLFLFVSAVFVECYYKELSDHDLLKQKEKVTHLHFFLNDTLSGSDPSAVLVANAENANFTGNPTPFSSIFAIHDDLLDGPGPDAKSIGNAEGLYAITGKEKLSLVLYVDFGFTTGKYNGSSISVFSRNPVGFGDKDREVAVVGGRGKFKLARGFAKLKTSYFNVTNGDALIEYEVTVWHY